MYIYINKIYKDERKRTERWWEWRKMKYVVCFFVQIFKINQKLISLCEKHKISKEIWKGGDFLSDNFVLF